MRLFYTRFAELCKDRGVSPSAAVEAIGLNKANASFWKRGSLPSSKNIQKLSEYFSVPVDYLLRDENDLASFPWLLDAPDADIPKEALDDAALRRGLARAQEQLSAAEKKGFQPEIKRWRSKCTDLCEMIEQLKKHKYHLTSVKTSAIKSTVANLLLRPLPLPTAGPGCFSAYCRKGCSGFLLP